MGIHTSIFIFLFHGNITTRSPSFIFFSDEAIADGKITFKKPEKRSSESDLNTSSAKKKKDSIKALQSNSKKVKDKKLLSFGDEEDEDDT